MLLYSATPSAACSATFAAGEITSGGVGQTALKLAQCESPRLMSQSPEIDFFFSSGLDFFRKGQTPGRHLSTSPLLDSHVSALI